jgi:hypothetical protein
MNLPKHPVIHGAIGALIATVLLLPEPVGPCFGPVSYHWVFAGPDVCVPMLLAEWAVIAVVAGTCYLAA